MRTVFSTACLVAAALLLPTAHAGTVNAYAFAPITPLQDTVTYRTATSNTQLGFAFGQPGGSFVTQLSGNSLNRVTLTIDFTVTDPQETLSFIDAGFYLPAGCVATTAPAAPVAARVVCSYRQTRAGFTLPSFLVFLNAPEKKVNGAADDLGTDKVSVSVGILYAEGGNGADTSIPNSSQNGPQAAINLGTTDPVDVRTAVSRGGVGLKSGLNGTGVPLNTTNQRHTELVDVPALPGAFTVASIKITKVLASDPTLGNDCLGAGNLTECPTYQTTVADPFTNVETLFTDPTKPLKTTYRVDASTLKRGANQILNAVKLYYTGGPWTNQEVPACGTAAPRGDGLPCLATPPICYKNNYSVVDLRGDCEWQLINTSNGNIKIQ